MTATPSNFSGVPAGSLIGTPPNAAMGNAYASQVLELEKRAKLLDDNNRQLHTQLAQSQQQMQLFKERSELMQRQLQDVSNQLQQARYANAQNSSTRALTESAPGLQPQNSGLSNTPARRSGARLTANTSNRLSSESIRDLGFDVQDDHGLVRLRIPADQLFQPNTAQLTTSAAGILDRIAESLKRNYPQQRINIEGHTDNAPLYGGTYSTSHQLASAQANAVLEQLTRRNQVSPTQFTTAAQGSNFPLSDNQTPAGRANNRRIEFVVYPESY